MSVLVVTFLAGGGAAVAALEPALGAGPALVQTRPVRPLAA